MCSPIKDSMGEYHSLTIQRVIMASNTTTVPQQTSIEKRQRNQFILLIILELALVLYIGFKLIQVEAVVDRVEVSGDFETVYYRNEIVGDPALLALIILGAVLPLASRRIRREPV